VLVAVAVLSNWLPQTAPSMPAATRGATFW